MGRNIITACLGLLILSGCQDRIQVPKDAKLVTYMAPGATPTSPMSTTGVPGTYYVYSEQQGKVVSVFYSPNGAFTLTGSTGGGVRVYYVPDSVAPTTRSGTEN